MPEKLKAAKLVWERSSLEHCMVLCVQPSYCKVKSIMCGREVHNAACATLRSNALADADTSCQRAEESSIHGACATDFIERVPLVGSAHESVVKEGAKEAFHPMALLGSRKGASRDRLPDYSICLTSYSGEAFFEARPKLMSVASLSVDRLEQEPHKVKGVPLARGLAFERASPVENFGFNGPIYFHRSAPRGKLLGIFASSAQ
jgi:hypothetical protein